MSEMIERVAKAIYESKLFQPARADDPWDGEPTVTKTFCRDAARAAIEAMRTPTSEMLKPEVVSRAEARLDGTYQVKNYLLPIMDIWPQMIDAALSEKP